MQTFHYKVQTSTFGLFVGLAAEAIRTGTPPRAGDQVSARVWLDTSQVTDVFRDTPLTLTDHEIGWLRVGLQKIAGSIETLEPTGYILISVRALEIVEADYAAAALAPALAGWAAAEFGLTPPTGHATLDTTSGQYVFDWDD